MYKKTIDLQLKHEACHDNVYQTTLNSPELLMMFQDEKKTAM
jgi:hypothetical protein